MLVARPLLHLPVILLHRLHQRAPELLLPLLLSSLTSLCPLRPLERVLRVPLPSSLLVSWPEMPLHLSHPLVETELRPNRRRYVLAFACLRVACAMALHLTLVGSLQPSCSMLHARRVVEAFCSKPVVEAETKVCELVPVHPQAGNDEFSCLPHLKYYLLMTILLTGDSDPPTLVGFSASSPSSPLWLRYNERAAAYDKERVDQWISTVNVVLLFVSVVAHLSSLLIPLSSFQSGLFGGVLGSFVIDAYHQLPRDLSNLLSQEQLSRRSQILRVNCFLFASLALNLAAAITSILVKDWAKSYLQNSPQFTTPRDKALARQLRLEKAQQWFLPQIVLFTPIIIQLSIVLFLVAVLDLLFNIEVILAYVLLSIESSFLLLFIFTSIIALSTPFGPYRSPLVNMWFLIGSLLFPSYRPSDRERRVLARERAEGGLELRASAWLLQETRSHDEYSFAQGTFLEAVAGSQTHRIDLLVRKRAKSYIQETLAEEAHYLSMMPPPVSQLLVRTVLRLHAEVRLNLDDSCIRGLRLVAQKLRVSKQPDDCLWSLIAARQLGLDFVSPVEDIAPENGFTWKEILDSGFKLLVALPDPLVLSLLSTFHSCAERLASIDRKGFSSWFVQGPSHDIATYLSSQTKDPRILTRLLKLVAYITDPPSSPSDAKNVHINTIDPELPQVYYRAVLHQVIGAPREWVASSFANSLVEFCALIHQTRVYTLDVVTKSKMFAILCFLLRVALDKSADEAHHVQIIHHVLDVAQVCVQGPVPDYPDRSSEYRAGKTFASVLHRMGHAVSERLMNYKGYFDVCFIIAEAIAHSRDKHGELEGEGDMKTGDLLLDLLLETMILRKWEGPRDAEDLWPTWKVKLWEKAFKVNRKVTRTWSLLFGRFF